MMMVSNGFNFSPNGYYNPPKPQVTTKNYQEAIEYGDDKKYGGNGDGKLSDTELANIKKTFDYAADYYKNMYQQSGDAKYMAWSDHYSRDSKATDNMIKNFSVFQQADPSVTGGVTDKGITTLARLDGRGETISLRDLAKQQFPNFVENERPPFPPMGGQSLYGMNAPFPTAQDLTYLKAKADNPQAWDGAAFAQGAISRSTAVDTSRDGQISYAEAINSPDGLLGNGILRLPPDSPQTRALWDALSGPDGKINPQELAATILSVDGNANGTVTAQEADKFLQDTMAKLAQNPNAAISTYNNFQAGASAFGLDKFLQNPEAAYALQFEQQINVQQQKQTQGDTLSLLQQADQLIQQSNRISQA